MSVYPQLHYQNQHRHRVCTLPGGNRTGFALVIALALMSFILLLVLSLTVFIRVESAAVGVAQQQLKAKTNALLALNVAIGSLQKYAGADQVATAGADLGGVPEAGRLHWTGVWQDSEPDTAANPQRPPTNPDFLGWLVSAGETGVSAWADDGEETVTLVNLAGALEVEAPVVRMANNQGGYAWWVGDENRKARLALEDFNPQAGESPVLPFALAQGSGKRISIPALELMASAVNRSSIRSPATATLASGIPPATLGPYFHDVSFVSESLLTNARDGGLRMDLTTAFRDDAQFTRLENSYGEQLFPALGSFDPGGPHWAQLRSYSRLHEAVVGTGSGARVAMRRQTNSQHGLAPVMNRASLWFGMVAAPDPSVAPPDPAPEQLRLLLFPGFSFWNPYNIDLEIPAFYVRHTRRNNNNDSSINGFLIKAHDGNPSWDPTDEGDPGISGNPTNPLFLGVTPSGQHLDFKIPAFTLPAGETRVFSIDGHRPYNPNDADQNELVMGWYPGMGLYLDSGFPYDRVGQPDMTLQVFGTSATHGWFLSTEKPQPFVDIQNAFIQIAGVHAQQNNLGVQYYPELQTASPAAPYPVDSAAVVGSGITTLLRLAENSIEPFNTGRPHSLQWLGNNNPRAAYVAAMHDAGTEGVGNPVTYISRLLNDKASYNFDVNGDSTFVGHSDISGRTQVTLFDVPRAEDEMLTLGQLMHANLGNHRDQTGFTPLFAGQRMNYTESYRPAYVVGNDAPQFLIEGAGVIREGFDSRFLPMYSFVYDYPWLVNHALWDRFFFSTLPSGWAQTNVVSGENLPSRRVKIAGRGTTRIEDLRDSSLAAAALTLEGGFNVNSTSADAWALLLGSLGGENPLRMDGSTAPIAGETTTVFARVNRSAHNGFRSGDSYSRGSDAVYGGFRELSATEVRALADAIVTELQSRRGGRGPFTSLADFINRSRQLDATAVESYRGLLQRAINNSGINDAFLGNSHMIRGPVLAPAGGVLPNSRNRFPADFDTQSGSVLADLPGYLAQMDILARLGHLLTVRSDTFTIRVMGESATVGNTTSSRAYVEATVRRRVEFVEPFADPASPDTPEKALTALQPINQQFGRRFEIVDLRWLNEDML